MKLVSSVKTKEYTDLTIRIDNELIDELLATHKLIVYADNPTIGQRFLRILKELPKEDKDS